MKFTVEQINAACVALLDAGVENWDCMRTLIESAPQISHPVRKREPKGACLDTAPDRIWLEPACAANSYEGRHWCRDDNGPCEECGARWIEYCKVDWSE